MIVFNGLMVNLVIAVSTLIVLWLIYLWKRNAAIVDFGWALGLTIIGLVHNLIIGEVYLVNILVSFLVLMWGVRLGGYLFWTRLRLGKKDARYETLQKKQRLSAPVFFLIHYLVQACFQVVVGLVFVFTSGVSVLDLYNVSGLFLWLVGYCGLIVADGQLHRFRSSLENCGKVCRVGVWNYSRHPNYFFEIMLWFGLAFFGLSTRLGWLGFVSPIALLLTMRFITGPISERQSLQSKPEAYRLYQDTTSMIIPWFKRSAQGYDS